MDIKKITEQILALRYVDGVKTFALCKELTKYVETHPDPYLEAFANTYLGDYYVGQNEPENAFVYLLKAREIAEEILENKSILASIYSFMGIAYEMAGNEQSAIMNYLKGMSIAKEKNNRYMESINMNNLAVIFQRYNHSKKALEYFLKAEKIQASLTFCPSRSGVLSNIGDIYVTIGEAKKAHQYYRRSEEEVDEELKEFYHARNECCYFAAINNKEKAIFWATEILEHVDFLEFHSFFGAYDHFNLLCQSMFKIGKKEYILAFLSSMEQTCYGNTNELQIIEDYKMKYTLMFCEKSTHAKAYYRYYCKTQEFKEKVNQDIAKSMKDKIYLNELIVEKEELKLAHKDLEKEVNLDEMTGVFNRRYVEILIKQYAQATGMKLGVIMFDIDYFKEFNDAYGHGQGDYALRVVGDSLKAFRKATIYPCRYGGDEFICFLEDASDQEAMKYIQSVQHQLYQIAVEHKYSPCSDRVTLSIGYALEDVDKVSVYDLLTMADDALYESKLSGRNMFKKKGVCSV